MNAIDQTYSCNHEDWSQAEKPTAGEEQSFFQTVFGSCSGVIDAASVIFAPSASCRGVQSRSSSRQTRRRGQDAASKKPRGNRSPSLRKSEEVLEIPEYLSTTEGRDPQGFPQITTDDISEMSCFTLDEMARQKVLSEMQKSTLTTAVEGPPSPTASDVSEAEPFPAGDGGLQITPAYP